MDEPLLTAVARLLQSLTEPVDRTVLGPAAVEEPKTANPAHMESNAAVDFVISDADMTALGQLPRIESYGKASAMPVFWLD